jgi:hypothetical protein
MERDAFLRADGGERLINEAIRHARVCSQATAQSAITRSQFISMPTKKDSGRNS